MKYSIIGLGNLGEKISSNLLKAGFDLKVFDKDERKTDSLLKKGARLSRSYSDAAFDVDGLITCLPSPEISTEVMTGSEGALYNMSPGSTWIETSTTQVDELKKVSTEARKFDVGTIESPVTGGVHRAARGEITVLVGANINDYEKHKRAIKTFGGKVFYLGDVGSASVLKVITNMLAFANLLGAIEGLMLAKSAGLNLTTSYHAIQASSGNSVEFETVAPVIFNGSLDTSFSLKLACKDLGLMTQLGELHKIPLDFTKFIEQVFINTKNRHGENAWTPSMVNDIEQETGLNLREPNFPNKMMDYQDVVNFLDKNQNSK